MWPELDDLIVIYGVLTPTAVLFWHTTAILLQKWVGGNPAKLAVGLVATVVFAYFHNWFRRVAAGRSNVVVTIYETVYDYAVRLSCLCYALGCRSIYDLLVSIRFMHPALVAAIAAGVLIRMGGFRNVLKLPFVVYNDKSVDRYRPPSTLTFSAGTILLLSARRSVRNSGVPSISFWGLECSLLAGMGNAL